jgi:hypothetical protein
MMVRFMPLMGHLAFRFLENTLPTCHDRWLNFFNFWPVASLD